MSSNCESNCFKNQITRLRKMKKRYKILIIIAVLLIILCLGLIIILFSGGGEDSHYTKEGSLIDFEREIFEKNNSTRIYTGVQQIMIGTKCGSYDDALNTLKEIKKAGYDGIELNDFMIHKASILIKLMTKFSGMPIGNGGKHNWQKLIAESGLKVTALHSYLNAIEDNLPAVAEEAISFGTDTVVITGMYKFDYSDINEVRNLTRRLDNAGKGLSEYGVKLLYHNHNVELQKVSKDKTAYDIIIEETNPQYVNFELDTYWMTDGGANVLALMEKLGNRMVMWHINDRGCTKKGPYMTPILEENPTELGNGNMDLNALLEMARKNNVKCIVLETHKNWIDDDPLKSIQVSSNFFIENGLILQ